MTRDEDGFSHSGVYSWFGFYYEKQFFGQVIFQKDLPGEIEYIDDEPKRVEVLFRYPRNRIVSIKMLIGVSDAQDASEYEEAYDKYTKFLTETQETETDEPLFFWNYQEMIKDYKVSFVVCRNQEVYMKFSEDPNFRFIFNCGNVGIFQAIK
jgi:hypothetical protein